MIEEYFELRCGKDIKRYRCGPYAVKKARQLSVDGDSARVIQVTKGEHITICRLVFDSMTGVFNGFAV